MFDARAGTRRAVMAREDTDRSCCLNTGTVVALCFVGNDIVCSGGYDKSITTWSLEAFTPGALEIY